MIISLITIGMSFKILETNVQAADVLTSYICSNLNNRNKI